MNQKLLMLSELPAMFCAFLGLVGLVYNEFVLTYFSIFLMLSVVWEGHLRNRLKIRREAVKKWFWNIQTLWFSTLTVLIGLSFFVPLLGLPVPIFGYLTMYPEALIRRKVAEK